MGRREAWIVVWWFAWPKNRPKRTRSTSCVRKKKEPCLGWRKLEVLVLLVRAAVQNQIVATRLLKLVFLTPPCGPLTWRMRNFLKVSVTLGVPPGKGSGYVI